MVLHRQIMRSGGAGIKVLLETITACGASMSKLQ